MYNVGIDIGTGSVKAVAVDEEGRTVATQQVHYELLTMEGGRAEQDADVVAGAFWKCLEALATTQNGAPALVGLSSYMHGLMAIDENHRPLTPIMLWSDTRSGEVAAGLRSSDEGRILYEETGTPLHSMSPLCKILWMKEQQPSLYKKAAKFISIKEYIWYNLFGAYEIDVSVASATGLYDLSGKCWNDRCLRLCGITKEQLSTIRPSGYLRKPERLPQNASSLFKDTVFCIGGSDGCLANLGSGVLEEGQASLTIGTSGAVRITTRRPLLQFPEMTFCYMLDDELFVCGGPINNGGNLIQWVIKKFWGKPEAGEEEFNAFFKEVATVPAGSEGLLFLPYVYGERAPVWNEKASGVFIGVRDHHTTAHFLRAALEGLCLSLKQVAGLLETKAHSLKTIFASGGFTQSQVWVQVLADVMGKPTCLQEAGDASAAGAAYLAMKSAGYLAAYPSPLSGQIIQPDPRAHVIYKACYDRFVKIYPAVHSIE